MPQNSSSYLQNCEKTIFLIKKASKMKKKYLFRPSHGISNYINRIQQTTEQEHKFTNIEINYVGNYLERPGTIILESLKINPITDREARNNHQTHSTRKYCCVYKKVEYHTIVRKNAKFTFTQMLTESSFMKNLKLIEIF